MSPNIRNANNAAGVTIIATIFLILTYLLGRDEKTAATPVVMVGLGVVIFGSIGINLLLRLREVDARKKAEASQPKP